MPMTSCNDWRPNYPTSMSLLANNGAKVANKSVLARGGLKSQKSVVSNVAEVRRLHNVDSRGYKTVQLGNCKTPTDENRLLKGFGSSKGANVMLGGVLDEFEVAKSQSSCSDEFSYYSDSPGSALNTVGDDEENRIGLKHSEARLLKHKIEKKALPVVSEETENYLSKTDSIHDSVDILSQVSPGSCICRPDLLLSQNNNEEVQNSPSIACLRYMYSKLHLVEARNRLTYQQISPPIANPLLTKYNKLSVPSEKDSIGNPSEISETQIKKQAICDNFESRLDGHIQDDVVTDSLSLPFDEASNISCSEQQSEAFGKPLSSNFMATSCIRHQEKLSATKIGLSVATSTLTPGCSSEVRENIIKSSEATLKISKCSPSSSFAAKCNLLLQNTNLARVDVSGKQLDQNHTHRSDQSSSSGAGLDLVAFTEQTARKIDKEQGHPINVQPDNILFSRPAKQVLGVTGEDFNNAACKLGSSSYDDAPDRMRSEITQTKGKLLKTLIKDRHYTLYETLSIQEDVCHEFKGHRSISVYDIPKPCMDSLGEASRNSVSVSMCGFLNTGLGGTIYLGVTDNANVIGLRLTLYQRDHLVTSVQHTLSRFTPRVPARCCWVNFVPVLRKVKKKPTGRGGGMDGGGTEDEVQRVEGGADTAKQGGKACEVRQDENGSDEEVFDDRRREQPHAVSQPRHCWCDADAAARIHIGDDIPLYVVEIHIRPWEPHEVLPWLKLSNWNHTDGRPCQCPAETISATTQKVLNTSSTTTKERKEGAACNGPDCNCETSENLRTLRFNGGRSQTPLNDHKVDVSTMISSNERGLEIGSKTMDTSNNVSSSLTNIPSDDDAKGVSRLTLYKRCARLLPRRSADRSGKSDDEFRDRENLLKHTNLRSMSKSTDSSGLTDAGEIQCKLKSAQRFDCEEKMFKEKTSRGKCDFVARVDLFDRSQLPYLAPFPPLYLDEIGICHFRQSSGHLRLTLSDVQALLQHRVQEHYTLLAQALSLRAQQLRARLIALGDDEGHRARVVQGGEI